MVEYLDRLSPAAEAIGAVNCVIHREGELIGDNTDGKGFLQSVSSARAIAGARGVILGAGGAARAIGVELALAGAEHLTVVNRTADRGASLARLIRDRTGASTEFVLWEGAYQVADGTDLLINATSIGLYPNVDAEVAIDVTTLQPGTVVCDVIPNPPRTRLVREAERRGCIVLDGLGMLVNQGVIGIRLWAGRDPRPDVMREALERAIATSHQRRLWTQIPRMSR